MSYKYQLCGLISYIINNDKHLNNIVMYQQSRYMIVMCLILLICASTEQLLMQVFYIMSV